MLAGEKLGKLPAPVLGQVVDVFPQPAAGSSVDGEHPVVLRLIHHSVVVQGGVLSVGFTAGRENPGNSEIPHVARIQLRQKAVTMPSPVAVAMKPRRCRVGGQHRIRDSSLRFRSLSLYPCDAAHHAQRNHNNYACESREDNVHDSLLIDSKYKRTFCVG